MAEGISSPLSSSLAMASSATAAAAAAAGMLPASVVVELGTAFIRAGFAREAAPRAQVRPRAGARAWAHALRCSAAHSERAADVLELELRAVYLDVLRVAPQLRRAVLLVPPHASAPFVAAARRVLSERLRAPAAALVLAPVACLAARPARWLAATILVVDVGFAEARAIPVVHGAVWLHAMRAAPIGMRAVARNVRAAVRAAFETAGVRPPPEDECVLGDEDAPAVLAAAAPHAAHAERPLCYERLAGELCAARGCGAGGIASGQRPLRVSAGPVDVDVDVNDPMAPLFVPDDDDERPGLVELTLAAIAASPIDARSELAAHVLFTGAAAELPGFRARFSRELRRCVDAASAGADDGGSVSRGGLPLQAFRVLLAPCPASRLAWYGGSVLSSGDCVALELPVKHGPS